MLQTHYRSPLDFSDERLNEAASALGRIENAVRNLDWQMENASAEVVSAAGRAGAHGHGDGGQAWSS